MKKILSLMLLVAFAGAGAQGAAVEAVQTSETQAASQNNSAEEIAKLEAQKQILVALCDSKNFSTSFLRNLVLVYGFGLVFVTIISIVASIDALQNPGGAQARLGVDYQDRVNEEVFIAGINSIKGSGFKMAKLLTEVTAGSVYNLSTNPKIIGCAALGAVYCTIICHDENMNDKAKIEEEISAIDTQIEELKQEKQICSGLPVHPADVQIERTN